MGLVTDISFVILVTLFLCPCYYTRRFIRILFCAHVRLQRQLMSKIMYDIVIVDSPSCYVHLYPYHVSSSYPYYSVIVYENDKFYVPRPPINFHCLCE